MYSILIVALPTNPLLLCILLILLELSYVAYYSLVSLKTRHVKRWMYFSQRITSGFILVFVSVVALYCYFLNWNYRDKTTAQPHIYIQYITIGLIVLNAILEFIYFFGILLQNLGGTFYQKKRNRFFGVPKRYESIWVKKEEAPGKEDTKTPPTDC